MSDPRTSLNEILDELHDALEAADDLGDEARNRLRGTAREIREAVGDVPSESPHSFRERLNEAIESFEGDYPRLTVIVGRIADALSDMGI